MIIYVFVLVMRINDFMHDSWSARPHVVDFALFVLQPCNFSLPLHVI